MLQISGTSIPVDSRSTVTATLSSLVLESSNQLQWFVRGTCDLDDGVVFNTSILLFECRFKEIDDKVGVAISRTEDQGLLSGSGIKFLSKVAADDFVEGFGDDLFIKLIDFNLDLVRRCKQIDLISLSVVHRNLIASFPDDAACR